MRRAYAVRQSMGADDNEFVQEWYEENEEGLRGGWDAGRRDKELDADGVVGEVIFPDAERGAWWRLGPLRRRTGLEWGK